MNLKQALKERWYGQGFNVTPFLISGAAFCCDVMEEHLGMYYTHYLYVAANDFGDMNYYQKDLEDMNKIILKKLEQDPQYYHKVKKLYDKQMKESAKFYKEIDNMNLKDKSNQEIAELAVKASKRISYAVGVAHIIEPYVLVNDVKIKKELQRYIKDVSELNRIFSVLMAPVKESFANQYENALRDIAEGKVGKEEGIKKIQKDFFWIRNGYAGRYILTKEDIEEELESIKDKKPTDFKKLAKEKEDIIKRLKLPEKLVEKIRLTEFLTYWQDERKMHIIIAVDYADRLLEELAKRIGIDIKYLRYAFTEEIDLEKLKDKEFQEHIKKRRDGFIYIYNYRFNPKTDLPNLYIGDEYKEFVRQMHKEKNLEVKELTGMTASTGTVIGTVKVCTTKDSLSKVNKGDVLVASMTRPEYVPAMRKAAAIITDEGGITCHAAIVSRELGIPCIIGTKNATKVLKDGDLVEIKGNHGLVIVLERKR